MQRQLFVGILVVLTGSVSAQVDDEQTGAWYMYFWNTTFGESNWGLQGDIQYRNWDIFGDLEQLLIRGGLTYQPGQTPVKFTLGYANITTGEFGSGTSTFGEHRVYQEALLPHDLTSRFRLNHRFRYEQRWVENQDVRTRFRYNLFLNILLNQTEWASGTTYLALYNELFINGQRQIDDETTVEFFDRNRSYGALGYCIQPAFRLQLGYMQQTTNNWSKGQIQLSAHHQF